jgi:Asp-tRNA(Asn)/Glu-tRNA(Gln) amidotransferase A subunit family amidase
VIDEDAFVYQQLKDAGAVLIAKLSGEFAMDDIWFGGQTKTLNLQGSNGSSAGSASATVAGLVPLPLVQKPTALL